MAPKISFAIETLASGIALVIIGGGPAARIALRPATHERGRATCPTGCTKTFKTPRTPFEANAIEG
jgi:hypothetical protein